MKVCIVCNVAKTLEDYRKSSRYKDGYFSRCKQCMRKSEKEREDINKKRELRRKYREKNREKIRESDRKAYALNPQKFREKAKVSQKKYYNTEKGKLKYQKETEKIRQLYPEKARARSMLNTAICRGYITKPNLCSECLSDKFIIEGHHKDYSKPFEVTWLCRSCHMKLHRLHQTTVID